MWASAARVVWGEKVYGRHPSMLLTEGLAKTQLGVGFLIHCVGKYSTICFMNTVCNLFIVALKPLDLHNLPKFLFTITLPSSSVALLVSHGLNIKYIKQKYASLTSCSGVFFIIYFLNQSSAKRLICKYRKMWRGCLTPS